MSKVKNWLWDKAEDKLDSIINRVKTNQITKSQAVKEISDADEAWELIGFDTVEDVIDFVDEVEVQVTA
ncbi:MAG: hypothetical protein CMA64_00420 [Euryarchaeota archaeon]|jgi:predicted protein tyrosine phosphatase|nr:hypothetical protein [Euryarchaeota archaeon]